MLKKILIVHRTVGHDKDSRVRKLSKSLSGRDSLVTAFLWERENKRKEIETSPRSFIRCNKLLFASKNPLRGNLFVTFFEMLQEWAQCSLYMLRYRPSVVIVANHRNFLHLFTARLIRLFSRQELIIVWDLRELPVGFDRTRLFRLVFHFLCLVPDQLWVMNSGRRRVMSTTFWLSLDQMHLVPNFCDRAYFEAPFEKLDHNVEAFLDGQRYAYVQNPFNEGRFGFNSIASVLDGSEYKVVCSGRVDQGLRDQLVSAYGGAVVDTRVLFTGPIPERELQSLIDNAFFTIILYAASSLNNYYCDANRLYQSVARRLPVIVGSNPGLADYVSRYDLGLVLTDDGKDLGSLAEAVRRMGGASFSGFDDSQFKRAMECMSWERNEKIFEGLF